MRLIILQVIELARVRLSSWCTRRDSVTRLNILFFANAQTICKARNPASLASLAPAFSSLLPERCCRTSRHHLSGAPGGTRTPDLSVRNAAFYPLNYGCNIIKSILGYYNSKTTPACFWCCLLLRTESCFVFINTKFIYNLVISIIKKSSGFAF